MSVQFGRWNFDARPIEPDYLAKVDFHLAPYGPDEGNTHRTSDATIVYRAFHTSAESRSVRQPHVTPAGLVLTWDGRLDNRSDLIGQIGDDSLLLAADVSIVAAAYEKWRSECCAKLTGDWALSIWDPNARSLLLAKDLIGARPLYYQLDENQISWSSLLDPLVLLSERHFTLDEEYIAGWLSFYPAAHLTPYAEIRSVRPACCVVIRNGKAIQTQFRKFDSAKRIRYRDDSEYEEHFRTLLSQSIRRRIRSDRPVLAELSGGLDSSSIVCMADLILDSGQQQGLSRLDTVSYFDDSEPNWNERPFFTAIERKRGRTGCQIDVSGQALLPLECEVNSFCATPGALPTRREGSELEERVKAHGTRVLLSGLGGDELLGGAPLPGPELRDLVARADVKTLWRQLRRWALILRKPWLYLLMEASQGFLPTTLSAGSNPGLSSRWLKAGFVKKHHDAFSGYSSRDELFGALPSFQWNMRTLEYLRRQLSSTAFSSQPLLERRYPYLDADLMAFLYAIPREQLVRPGQRRSLMRRSLVGIVPDEVLNRRRKAYVARSIFAALSDASRDLMKMSGEMMSASLGIVDSKKFADALQGTAAPQENSPVAMLRTIALELWLRNMEGHISLSPVRSGANAMRPEGDLSGSIDTQPRTEP